MRLGQSLVDCVENENIEPQHHHHHPDLYGVRDRKGEARTGGERQATPSDISHPLYGFTVTCNEMQFCVSKIYNSVYYVSWKLLCAVYIVALISNVWIACVSFALRLLERHGSNSHYTSPQAARVTYSREP